MTVSEVKTQLEEVQNAHRSYLLAKEEAERFRAAACGGTAKLSDVPHTGSGNGTENKLLMLISYENKADELFGIYEERRLSAEAMICSLKNGFEREVLLRRYIFGQKWDEISNKMCYSREHIRRIHNSAIKKLTDK